MPDNAAYQKLSTLIVDLSTTHDTPTFEPHVTLLSGITDEISVAIQKTEELANSLIPVSATLTRIEFLEVYYRCLFFCTNESEDLMEARTLAEAIFEDDKLKGNITAGLFIGEGKNKNKFPKTMGETHVIENREEIISNPPDILLTNFKMLDYGLMRHNYNKLWSHNFENPELLRFLVLDELHTYDGAQGTDVANLIRRLKLKLTIPVNYLCPIGTSATIGKGEDAVNLLTKYASDVFGETFPPESVIVEHRLSSEDFYTIPDDKLDTFLPRVLGIQQSRLKIDEKYHNSFPVFYFYKHEFTRKHRRKIAILRNSRPL